MRLASALIAAVVAVGCGDDGDMMIEDEPIFPVETYADTYVEVRNCRQSGGAHDINFFKVLADPAALDPYNNRTDPFPEGAVVLKEEYELGDTDCSGDVIQWSVMVRDSAAPAELMSWRWQRVSSLGVVLENNTLRCTGCHMGCGFPPDGYEGTCTVP